MNHNFADTKAAAVTGMRSARIAWGRGEPVIAEIHRDGILWRLGSVVVVTPRLIPDAPPIVRDLLERRALVGLLGFCPCGGVTGVDRVSGQALGTVEHATSCDVPRIELLNPWLESA